MKTSILKPHFFQQINDLLNILQTEALYNTVIQQSKYFNFQNSMDFGIKLNTGIEMTQVSISLFLGSELVLLSKLER